MDIQYNITDNINKQIPKHADVKIIKIDLNIRKVQDIIIPVLKDSCNVNIIGFNNNENFYWCKIEKNKKCLLYTKIILGWNDYDSTLIIIINEIESYNKNQINPLFNVNYKKQFFDSVIGGLYLYQKSSLHVVI